MFFFQTVLLNISWMMCTFQNILHLFSTWLSKLAVLTNNNKNHYHRFALSYQHNCKQFLSTSKLLCLTFYKVLAFNKVT